MDCEKDFKFITGDCTAFECWQAVAEVSLDCRKGQLNGVVVGGVRGEKLASHTPEKPWMSSEVELRDSPITVHKSYLQWLWIYGSGNYLSQ